MGALTIKWAWTRACLDQSTIARGCLSLTTPPCELNPTPDTLTASAQDDGVVVVLTWWNAINLNASVQA